MGVQYITAQHGITGDGVTVLSPVWVGMEGSKICYVSDEKPNDATAENTVDMGDATLTPGLLNLHDHINRKQMRKDSDQPLSVRSNQFMTQPHEYMMLHGVHNLKDMLGEGIGFVRDFGLGGTTALNLKRGVKEGLIPGPELMVCGMDIAQTGGHCYKYAREVDGVPDMMRAVREQIKAGADFIKIMASGGLESFPKEDPKYPEFTQAELNAAAEVAHDAGKKITAHAYSTEAIHRILLAGFDCVEHGVLMDDWSLNYMVEHNIPIVPTMSGVRASYFIKPVSAEKQAAIPLLETRIWGPHAEAVKKEIEAGLLVGTGTDTYGYLADEIRLIAAAADLTPVQAMAHATSISAKIVDRDDLGLLEVGKHANVAAFPGDVTKSLDTIDHVKQFWLHGQPTQ